MAHSHAVTDDVYRPRDPNHQASPSGSLHQPGPGEDGHGAHVGHTVPVSLLAAVLGILLFLTFLTVAAIWVDLGRAGNVWVALGIATVKAIFVAMYFMHLRWDSTFNTLIFVASLVFLTLFIGISLMDSQEYAASMEPPGFAQVGQTSDSPGPGTP